MKATITWKRHDGTIAKHVEDNVEKIEKVFVKAHSGKIYEETRVYTNALNWRAWISEAIINIFLEA